MGIKKYSVYVTNGFIGGSRIYVIAAYTEYAAKQEALHKYKAELPGASFNLFASVSRISMEV